MKKTSSFLTGFLALLVAAGLLSSAGTAQARLVYTANFTSGTIGAGTISSWDTSNPGAGVTTIIGGLNGPVGVATDSLGNIYISAFNIDTSIGSIQKYTQGGSFITSLTTAGLTFGLAFDSSDNLYYNVGVGTFGGTPGTYKTTASLTSPSFFASGSEPTGMFINTSGNVTVANINGNNSYVSTYNSSGGLIDTFSNPTAFNPMDTSIGVTRDAAGNYYVSSRATGNVSKWDSNGDLVNGAFTSGGGDAYGLLIDGSTLFVADHFGSTINYYNLASGAYQGQFSAGTGALPTYMTFATTAPVPEPGTWAAAALLASGAAFMRWRKRAKVA
jgi:hypothetical protein